ncbi:hypothetical protein R1flu_020420 [Riccia fluitans]|uniref:Expansin n=1 Tax=Riccia fluitans TaxID=41844 RepID=A0ABD1ZLG0_9MARC
MKLFGSDSDRVRNTVANFQDAVTGRINHSCLVQENTQQLAAPSHHSTVANMRNMSAVERMAYFGMAILLFILERVELAESFALQSYAVSRTTFGDATATFYGGNDASGTAGGSCGYLNPFTTGYGATTAAISNSLLNSNLNCGACFEVKCKYSASDYTRKWCYQDKSVVITATNQSPQGLNGEHHFDLTYPMFTRISNSIAGRIPVQYRRVSCKKQGGIKFTLNGNPYFNLVLVYNVGGAGNVYAMQMKGSKSTNWNAMSRNWGQNWQAMVKLTGQSLAFRVTLGNGRSKDFFNVAPSNWQFGQTYAASSNFY